MPCCNGIWKWITLDSRRLPPGGSNVRAPYIRARHRTPVTADGSNSRSNSHETRSRDTIRVSRKKRFCAVGDDRRHTPFRVWTVEITHHNRKVLNSIWPFPRRFLAFSEVAIRQVREMHNVFRPTFFFGMFGVVKSPLRNRLRRPSLLPHQPHRPRPEVLPFASPNLQYGSLLVQKVGRCRH